MTTEQLDDIKANPTPYPQIDVEYYLHSFNEQKSEENVLKIISGLNQRLKMCKTSADYEVFLKLLDETRKVALETKNKALEKLVAEKEWDFVEKYCGTKRYSGESDMLDEKSNEILKKISSNQEYGLTILRYNVRGTEPINSSDTAYLSRGAYVDVIARLVAQSCKNKEDIYPLLFEVNFTQVNGKIERERLITARNAIMGQTGRTFGISKESKAIETSNNKEENSATNNLEAEKIKNYVHLSFEDLRTERRFNLEDLEDKKGRLLYINGFLKIEGNIHFSAQELFQLEREVAFCLTKINGMFEIVNDLNPGERQYG